MREQPALRFVTYDIDCPARDTDVSVNYITALLNQDQSPIIEDREFAQREGCLYTNRFEVDESLNTIFRQGQEKEKKTIRLGDAKPCALEISRPGSFDTISFKHDDSVESTLPHNFVQVSVQSVGLNAKVCL